MTTNLVQTCKTSANRINLNRTAMRVALIGLFITLGIGNAWAFNSDYYSQAGVAVKTGAGTVYVGTSTSYGTSTTGSSVTYADKKTTNASSAPTDTWYIKAVPDAGYAFTSWTTGGSWKSAPSTSTATTSGTITASESTAQANAQANFTAVTVNSVSPTSVNVEPTNADYDYKGDITFVTSNANLTGVGDFNATPTTDGNFTITWTRDGDNVKASFKFNGGGSYGGASRNNSTTVSLQSKASGSAAKTCTVTANFPALAFVGVEATDVYATQGESGKTGSATFTYNYGAEDDFPTAPTLTPVSGTGALAITGYTVTPNFSDGTCEVTVDYTYDTNNGVGDTEATLTLTAANGDARSVTIAGHSEALATNDASVTPAGGSPTEYATFAEALAAANGLTGSTLTLLRNVDLGTIAATQTISKAMTIDLNGKTLQANVTTAIPLLTIGKNVAVTIQDSKSGGMIYNTGEIDGVVYGVTVSKGTLNVTSGTIKAENTQQYFYGTSSVGGTATNKTGVGARGIQQAAATTVNISGNANIQAIASRNAFGIREESSNANTTTLNITGGTIYAEAPALAYGVYALGKVNMSNGVVSTKLNTNLVNGNETWMSTTSASKWANNAVHREGHGIYMSTYARAAKTSCYYGTLTMTGGSISVVNENTTLVGTTIQSEPIYGIYFGASVYGVGAGKTATDGTMSQKASAIGSISNATITVTNASQPSYGVMSYGYYNSADESEGLVNIDNSTVNVTSYQSAYGILANVGISSDYGGCYAGRMMLENNNVTTTTTTGSTSVALYATGTMTTIKTATSATYAGEYASSGYIYVKSGTYTANSATSYATAAIAGPWTTSNAQRGAFKTYFAVDGSLGGNVESMSGIYISGGKFVANATTSHARGVWNSGTTIIAGGTFEANATTTNAYGIYSNRGVVQATGATLKAVAGTGTAYGVFSDAMINDYVGWKYAADYTLTNCNITASTTTGNTAYGVYISGTTRTISSVNSSYASIGDVVLGGYAIVGNASVKGCTINATSAGTTAGGIYRVNTQVSADKLDICQGELTATGNTIIARTNGGKTVYGIRSGGPSTISNNTITATSSSTDSYGVVVGDGEHTISGNTVTASGTGTVYGIQTYSAVNSTTGYKFQANATLEDNTVTATTTSGNTAYAVYVTTADGVNIASGTFAGDYVAAGSMVINSGKYTATAAGTTGYALVLDATKTKNAASGSATCTVNGGKFKGYATGGTYADVNASAGLGNLVLAGGYYVVNTNLNTYVADGYTATSLTSGDAYTEGYRYQISSEAAGAIVCKVYSGSTLKASYQSLEEAIGYVNQNASTTLTILMVDNCTLSEGEYTLPAKATLLVPYSGQTTAKTTSLERVYGYTKPTANIKLSFAPNAHLDVLGTIEAGSKQAGSGQTGGYNGAPHLSYGWIYLSAGSSMTLENGAKLFAWGYVTGAGEIDAKRGSTVYEMFQLTDWRGGTAISGMEGNSQKVMPVNQYYIQNVECPIKFRPGAIELCEGSCNMSSSVYPVRGKNTSTSIQFIGITGSGSLFMMDDEDVSNDTWVRKSYDAVNDKQVYEINSSAKIGGISITCCNLPLIGSKTLSSTDYVMPITNNIKIHLLSGSMYVTQNLELAAGAEIEVDKEATAYVNSGVSLYVFDTDEWDVFETKYNTKTYPVRYTPSWTTCPRSASNVPDAAINVHGKFIVNGNLYTTASGANIFSTNEDAGSITYNVAAPTGTKTVNVCNNTSQTYNSKTCYPAWLQNGTGITPAYSETAGTAAGKTWSYYDDKWQCWTQSGCFTYDALDNKYIKPAAYVQVTSVPDANHLYTDAATGTRKFVWDVDCYWWEVETTPTAEGYYKAINADHNGKYNYYYYDSANDYWVIKTIVVTWSINGSTTNYTVNYGTVPKWLGANPSIAATASVYYSWDGWTKGSTTGTFYSKYEDLPIATEAVTYYAHFETNKYSYTITFADANNGASVSKTFTADEIPVCPITPVKAPTTALMYAYDGWSTTSGGSKVYDKDDNLPAVSGTATYYAHFSSSARPYTITFQNFDGTVLQQSDVNYGTTPTYDGATPYRAKDAFYSYTFSEWSPAITSVTGEATYTAQYTSTTRGFTIQFVDYDGTVLEVKDVPRGQTPEYTGPAISREATVDKTYTFNSWSPALVEVTEDAIYTATYNETPRKYTITWIDGNDATLKTEQVAYGETPVYSGATPQKASTDAHSYVFNNTWLPAIVPVTRPATYTAQFDETPRTYRLDVAATPAGYGTVSPAYVTGIPYNTSVSVSDNTFTVNGTTVTATPAEATAQYTYAFSSWSNVPSKVTADVSNIQAVFTRALRSYSVTFNANGHGTAPATQTGIEYGSKATQPAAPTAEGYTFAGWYKEEECTNSWNFSTDVVTGPTTLFANWSAVTYDLTYEGLNGATNSNPSTYTIETATITLANPGTRTGYNFDGWTCGGSPITQIALGSTGDKTITANWSAVTYNLTYEGLNGATNSNPSTYTIETATIALVAPGTRTGYNFDGWTCGGSPITQITLGSTGNKTITANWSAVTYNLTYEGLNGATNSNPATYTVETATITLADPGTRTGYNFTGWTCGGSPITQIALGSTGDKTITANWEQSTVTILWMSEDGTQTLKTDEGVVIGSTPSFDSAEPTKATTEAYTYTFDGWSTEANGGGTFYAADALPEVSAAATYYAHFSATANVASVTVSGATTYYTTIDDAFAYVNTVSANMTITLLQDAPAAASLVYQPTSTYTCTLDLNNHTISGTFTKVINVNLKNAVLTIIDNSTEKGGKIKTEQSLNGKLYGLYITAGKVNLNAGTIECINTLQYNSSSAASVAAYGVYVYYSSARYFTMTGGTVKANATYNVFGVYSAGTTKLEGGNVIVSDVVTGLTKSGTGYGVYVAGATTTISKSADISVNTKTVAYGIYVNAGTANATGGVILAKTSSSTKAYGVHVNAGTFNAPEGSTTSITASAYSTTAYVIGTGASGTANIYAGTYEAKAPTSTGTTTYGVYSSGTTNIHGGTFTVSAKTSTARAIGVWRNTTIVDGNPVFNVSAPSIAYGATASGTTPKASTAGYSGTLKVYGGTFNVEATKTTTAYGVYAYPTSGYSQTTTGGTIEQGNYINAGTVEVHGGTFNVKAKTTDAYGVFVNNGTQTNAEAGDPKTAYGKCTITDGQFKVETTGDANATAYAMNIVATEENLTVQGGQYSTKRTNASETSNIEDKYTAPTKSCNYWVLPLDDETYNYKVAEAYTVSFNANGHGTAPSSQLIEKNQKATEPSAPSETGWTFGGWYKEAGCTNAWNFASDVVTGATTLYAKWTLAETGSLLDIIDWTTNGDGTGTLTINANGWAASGWPYTINDVEYQSSDRAADRTLTIPYSGVAGSSLQIKVQKAGGGILTLHNYKIPFINTIEGAGENDIVYVNSGTLSISEYTTLAALYVRPEASVDITYEHLNVNKLVLRTLPWQAASISGSFEADEVWYTRIAPNNRTISGPDGEIQYASDKYYQFALPLTCTVPLSEIQVSHGANTPYNKTWLLKRYDEPTRAANGAGSDNWIAIGAEDYIQGGVGYEMFSNSNYYREFLFPVGSVNSATYSQTRTSVAYDLGKAGKAHAGWNIICSPLMGAYENSDANPETGIKISRLMTDGSYDQGVPDYIYPAIPFSYQANENGGYLYFNESELVQKIVRRKNVADEEVRIQWIRLYVKDVNGRGDETSIISHPTRYDATYKTGIDVAKQSFEASRALIYSSHTYGEMAFAGVADSLLEAGIPLTIYSPSEQSLTISMRQNNWLNRLAYVWLLDKETGIRYDLLTEEYTFTALAGTTSGRFVLEGQFFAPEVTTDIDNIQNNSHSKALKFIYEDKMYIMVNGQVFDANGKKVK